MILWSYIVGRIFIERDKIDPVLYPPVPHFIFAVPPGHTLILPHLRDCVKRFGHFFAQMRAFVQ